MFKGDKKGQQVCVYKPYWFFQLSERSNSCNPICDAELTAEKKISLLVMSNAFLIIYSPHQHLTSQGEPVYTKWSKEEGPDK